MKHHPFRSRLQRTALLCIVHCALCIAVYAQPKCDSYLFAFFSNNTPDGEQIRFALSDDGINYHSLNEGRPVVASDTIALKKSIRDPHIIRAEDGRTFYMVLTDMRSDEGWQSNDGLVLMKSTDLLHWQHTTIDFPTRFAHIPELNRANLHAAWAPQTIWDPTAQKYMIYYSIGRHDWEYECDNGRWQPYFKLFYSYANEDFTDIDEPKLLFDFGSASIDGDIVYDKQNAEYVLFFKDEGMSKTRSNGFVTRQGVMRATSKQPTGPWQVEWAHLQRKGQYPVEGSSVFPLIDGSGWVLMYDCYARGEYQFCRADNLRDFEYVASTPTRGTFTPRHGSVVHITAQERDRLEAWSELAIATRHLAEAPTPTLTLAMCHARPTLLQQARHLLATSSDPRQLRDMAKLLKQ